MTPSEWATTFEWSKQHPYQVGDIVTMHVPWKQWSLWERLAYRLTHGLRSTPERVETLRVMAETDRLNGLKDQIHAYYESLLKSMQGDLDAALARVRKLEARLPQTAPCDECGRNEWEHPMAVCKCGNRIFW